MMGGIVPLTRRRRRCPAYANIPGLRSPRLRRGRPRAVLSRSRNGGPKTPISRAMDKVLGWARVWFAVKREDDEGLLRQGAWYPVLSSGVTRAVLEVSGQRVAVPQDMLEVRDKRPDRFTVVYRTYDDPNPARGTRADAGRRYGVCPKCATRIPFRSGIIPSRATCHKCKHEGIVAWWETGGKRGDDPAGDRTQDLRIKSPLLYQLSYRVQRSKPRPGTPLRQERL